MNKCGGRSVDVCEFVVGDCLNILTDYHLCSLCYIQRITLLYVWLALHDKCRSHLADIGVSVINGYIVVNIVSVAAQLTNVKTCQNSKLTNCSCEVPKTVNNSPLHV